MSTDTTEPDNTSGTETREVEKDVTIEAYTPMDSDEYADKREFLDAALLPEIDWYEREQTESTVYKLVLPNGREVSVDKSEFETVKDDIASGEVSNDDIAVKEDVERDSRHKHRTWSAGRKYRRRLAEALPESIGEHLYKSRHSYVDSRTEATAVSFNASVGQQRVLQHQQRRTDENRYESDDRTHAVTVNLSFGPAPADKVDEYSENVVPEVVKALRQEAWCERVRVAECKVERQGDCFV